MTILRVFLQSPLDTVVGVTKEETKSINADTVYGALIDLCNSHPSLRNRLFNGEQLNPFINVFLNGELVQPYQCKQQPITDYDELCLLFAIRGG